MTPRSQSPWEMATLSSEVSPRKGDEGYGPLKPLEPREPSVMRLSPDGRLCFTDGECLCRR
jgi:hypothetical protein